MCVCDWWCCVVPINALVMPLNALVMPLSLSNALCPQINVSPGRGEQDLTQPLGYARVLVQGS